MAIGLRQRAYVFTRQCMRCWKFHEVLMEGWLGLGLRISLYHNIYNTGYFRLVLLFLKPFMHFCTCQRRFTLVFLNHSNSASFHGLKFHLVELPTRLSWSLKHIDYWRWHSLGERSLDQITTNMNMLCRVWGLDWAGLFLRIWIDLQLSFVHQFLYRQNFGLTRLTFYLQRLL